MRRPARVRATHAHTRHPTTKISAEAKAEASTLEYQTQRPHSSNSAPTLPVVLSCPLLGTSWGSTLLGTATVQTHFMIVLPRALARSSCLGSGQIPPWRCALVWKTPTVNGKSIFLDSSFLSLSASLGILPGIGLELTLGDRQPSQMFLDEFR